MSDLLRGAASGLIATAPMTATMIVAGKIFPAHGARRLPPQQITEKIIEEGGHPKASLVSHFAFGSMMGAGYAGLIGRFPGNPLLKGMLFGASVWSVSYAGWLPLLKLQPLPQNQPRGRNISMLISHLVWGASLGLLEAGKSRDRPSSRCMESATVP